MTNSDSSKKSGFTRPLQDALALTSVLMLASGAVQAQVPTTATKIVSETETTSPTPIALKSVEGEEAFITMFNPMVAGGPTGSLRLRKNVVGGSATGSVFEMSVHCTSPVFDATVDVGANQEVLVSGIPAPNSCTITESPDLPAPPAGYEWDSESTPPAPLVATVPAGVMVLSIVTNTLREVQGATGSLRIRKSVVGGYATGSVFEMSVHCTSPAFDATVDVAAGQEVLVSGIPAPNSCTVTESANLPAPPSGYAWDSELTPPSPLAVTVQPGVMALSVVTNTLRSATPGGGASPPVGLPGLGQIGLGYLVVLLGLAARRRLRVLR
jgi:hypothetical protein